MKYESRRLIDTRSACINFRKGTLKNNTKVRVWVRMVRSFQIWAIQTVAENEPGNVVTLYIVAIALTRIEGERTTHSLTPSSDPIQPPAVQEATKLKTQ